MQCCLCRAKKNSRRGCDLFIKKLIPSDKYFWVLVFWTSSCKGWCLVWLDLSQWALTRRGSPLFLRGPQRKPSITSSWSITSDSQFITTSPSLVVSFREATRNHILMSFHDRICRTIKTFPFKQSHNIIIPLGKKDQRGQTKRLIFLFRFGTRILCK